MKGWNLSLAILGLMLAVTVTSCSKEDEPAPVVPHGKISFTVAHRVNGQPLQFNILNYRNAAGNDYMVTDLMYFISDITFYRHDGKTTMVSDWKDIFYIDEKMPETKKILFPDKIPVGSYDSISFIFGINEVKNKSHIFVNPPEVLMGWPDVLGGGYHYMMANGNWKDPEGNLQPFNFHLGIGQLYKGSTFNVDSIYAFVQNFFRVSLPGSAFEISDGDSLSFRLVMNFDRWFDSPHIYDHNYWGGAIMQNQAAQQMAKENGWNVFTIEKLKK